MSAAVLPHRRRFADDRARVLVTPEGIALPLTLASRGSRFGALLLDLVIISLTIVLTAIALRLAGLGTLFSAAKTGENPLGVLSLLYIVYLAAMFLYHYAYFLFFELGPRGATPGKRMAGIRIAARNGGRLSAEMVIARNLLRDIELFLPLAFIAQASGGDEGAAGFAAAAWFLIFALFPCFNKDRLRAGDLIAGTWVVEAPKRKLEQAMSAVAAPSPGDHAYKFGEAELGPYGEYELQTLERVLRENRAEALTSVAEAICGKIGWSPPTGGHERAFLESYYTQLRAHLESGMRFGKRKADKFEASLHGKASTVHFSEAELTVYGESQLHSLERVLREGDGAALQSVAAAIAGKIGRAEPHAEARRAFLEAYYTQLRARLDRGR